MNTKEAIIMVIGKQIFIPWGENYFGTEKSNDEFNISEGTLYDHMRYHYDSSNNFIPDLVLYATDVRTGCKSPYSLSGCIKNDLLHACIDKQGLRMVIRHNSSLDYYTTGLVYATNEQELKESPNVCDIKLIKHIPETTNYQWFNAVNTMMLKNSYKVEFANHVYFGGFSDDEHYDMCGNRISVMPTKIIITDSPRLTFTENRDDLLQLPDIKL